MFKIKRRRDFRPPVLIASCVRDCQKEKCPVWVTLNNSYVDEKGNKTEKMEGRCAIAWLPQMFIEVKHVLMEIRDGKKKD